jgi:hypothetical protein
VAREDFILNRMSLRAGRFPAAAIISAALYFGLATATFAANRAPTISGSPATTATVGTTYAFRPTASDPDGNKLTYKIRQKPRWATFSSTTGILTGKPSAAHVGTYSNIEIRVTDGKATRVLPKFAINVVKATDAPAPPPPSSSSSSVKLSWSPPTRNENGSALTNLAGYRVYYGKTSGRYAYSLAIGSAHITSAVIESLEAATWYFAIKSESSSGALSDFSTETSKTVF